MTNEELASRIRAGESALLLELWAGVRLFALQRANRRLRALGGRGGVTRDDLMQAAFLALLASLETWKAGEGSFLHWFDYHLKTAFLEATGGRTERRWRDPINNAISLETPLLDEVDATTLGEMVPDPAAEVPFEGVAETDRLARLRELLSAALDELPPDQSAALRAKYYRGEKVVDRKAHAAGLKALRHPRVSRRLMVFL